jgi:hypothetical protein
MNHEQLTALKQTIVQASRAQTTALIVAQLAQSPNKQHTFNGKTVGPQEFAESLVEYVYDQQLGMLYSS